MKKVFAILHAVVTGILLSPIAIIVLSTALIVLLIPVNMLFNNADLRAFERSFAAVEHPAASESLATASVFGHLGGGSSDSCDYFVGNVRSTGLPRDAIISHYMGATIAPPTSHLGSRTEVQLQLFDDDLRPPAPSLNSLFSDPEHWKIDPSRYADQTLYIAYALEEGSPPGVDIRCQ